MSESSDNLTPWRERAAALRSRGSQAQRPGSLAGLAAARRATQGQFFTPAPIVELMWRIARPAMEAALARRPGARIALFDNSIGAGAMFAPGNPEQHELAGCDIDQAALEAIAHDAEIAGFRCDFYPMGMQEVHASGFGVGFINPPFSLHLESPAMEPLPCTSIGRYGPNTSAVSHAYALDQSLAACDVVLAVLPAGFAAGLLQTPDQRLRAVLELPAGSFKQEGTDVATAIAVYGRLPGSAHGWLRLETLGATLPDLGLDCHNTSDREPRLRAPGVVDDGPMVKLPVTGDKRVFVAHDGRKVILKFRCGLTEALVRNAVLLARLGRVRPDEGRYPRGIRYKGQGGLDLELYLGDGTPCLTFERELLASIRSVGAEPVVDPGLRGYLARLAARRARQAVPFRRTAWVASHEAIVGKLKAKARRHVQCNPAKWGSAVFRAGEDVEFETDGTTYTAVHPASGENLALEGKAFELAFEAIGGQDEGMAWRVIHEGRAARFPALAAEVRRHLVRCGVDKVAGWDYQFDDLVELKLARHGVVAWEMGLGKTRAALGLCLAGGAHNLIVVEARLVGELEDQIEEVGLPPAAWQVIEQPEQCQNLRRINIISYSRLRMPVAEGAGRRTYARLLRRRVHTLVCDEAHLLRADDTAQTRAIHMISPKCRYPMTGTPVANYPRDLLPLIRYVGGDGTAIQEYGLHRPHKTPELRRSMTLAAHGSDVFRDRHVVTEWVTHTFEDNLTRGAKREVPKVRQLGKLREWAAPFILRRVAREPEVAKYVRTPPHKVIHHRVEWDAQHYAYWIGVADAFVAWYREARKRAGDSGNKLNLISLLARIGAVEMAGNHPQHDIKGFPYRGGLTSKQAFVIERALKLTRAGHKTVIFSEHPEMAERIASALAARKVETLTLTGKVPITERKARLKHFRTTDVPVLCATYGVGGTGLNIPEADRAIFATRTWTPKTENQARYRLLRPQQTRQVVFETVELPGSLDTYQAMMLNFKNDATNATVDYLEPQLEEVEFEHLDTVIERFVEEFANREGLSRQELRARIGHAN